MAVWVLTIYEPRTAFVGFRNTYEEFGASTKSSGSTDIHMDVCFFKTAVWVS